MENGTCASAVSNLRLLFMQTAELMKEMPVAKELATAQDAVQLN